MAPISDLVRFIVERYHEPLRAELPAVIALATRVESRHGDKASCPRGLRSHLETMHVDVRDHLAKKNASSSR